MRGAGRLELDRTVQTFFIKPVQCFFIVDRRDLLVGKIFSAARGDQQEDMMGSRAQLESQVENAFNLFEVGLCDGGVNLKFQPSLFHRFDPSHGEAKGTWNAPKPVVTSGV